MSEMSKADEAISRRMGMDADKWARHANPWSVWSRLATVPLFAAVIWSRAWIGWWCLAGVAAIACWLWLNVRLFKPAISDVRWETRAILGEKMWMERRHRSIGAHHLAAIRRLNVASALMVLPMGWGLWAFDPWATAFGSLGLVAGQLWALDRYAWVYADLTRDQAAESRVRFALAQKNNKSGAAT